MKTNKTREEFMTYMWIAYPEDSQLPEREGMLKAWNFLNGQYDHEEKEREQIKNLISNTMKEKGFGRNEDL